MFKVPKKHYLRFIALGAGMAAAASVFADMQGVIFTLNNNQRTTIGYNVVTRLDVNGDVLGRVEKLEDRSCKVTGLYRNERVKKDSSTTKQNCSRIVNKEFYHVCNPYSDVSPHGVWAELYLIFSSQANWSWIRKIGDSCSNVDIMK